MSDLDLLQQRFDRERAARKAAELLLEQKSRDLDLINVQLDEITERNTAILETASEGIAVCDHNGCIEFFNRSAQRIFCCDDVVGTDIRSLFERTTLDDAAFFPGTNATRTDGTTAKCDHSGTVSIQATGRRANGQTFAAELQVSRRNHDGASFFTVNIRDLSRGNQIEARLNHAKKMESIGQLASGIAHEINTPIQFVNSNTHFLKDAFQSVNELLELYEQLTVTVKDSTNPPLLQTIARKIDHQCEIADLPFLKDEIPSAFGQMIEGLDRVSSIVGEMKEFSQSSSDAKTQVNLNRTVENVLYVASNLYRDVATVTTSMDPNVTPLPCLSGQMKHVILNLLANAADAIATVRDCKAGKIHVSTRQTDTCVEIRVEDNGPGIPDEIRSRIFDPFFTTKAVGEGIGQGLAFVYDIVVNKHGGTVDTVTASSGGTTFVIALPLVSSLDPERHQHAHSIG